MRDRVFARTKFEQRISSVRRFIRASYFAHCLQRMLFFFFGGILFLILVIFLAVMRVRYDVGPILPPENSLPT